MPRAKKDPKYGLTEGAKLLRAHITLSGLNIPDWCDKHGVERITLQRVVNGDRLRISVDFALTIEKVTRGAVPVSAWASTKAMKAATRAA